MNHQYILREQEQEIKIVSLASLSNHAMGVTFLRKISCFILFLSPLVQVARWALLHRFLSVVCLSGLDQNREK